MIVSTLPEELLGQLGVRTQAKSGGIPELRRWIWKSGENKTDDLCRMSIQSTREENVATEKAPESSGKY